MAINIPQSLKLDQIDDIGASTMATVSGSSLINDAVFATLDDLSIKFFQAKPFKHIVIDEFLKPEVAELMLNEFPRIDDPSKLLNEFGVPNPKSHVSDIRGLGGVYEKIDKYIQSEDFLSLMSKITGIPELRYDPWYYGAGTHENFHGAGLDPHYDFNIHPNTKQHRRINAIIYLNKDWPSDWGGSISFHSNPWDLDGDEKVSIAPAFDRCVIFETTERSWHSVPHISIPPDFRRESRKSFTIYLYTNTRPDSEIAPEHGTVYVQEGLPKYIKAGHVLSDEDVELIGLNLKRRHNYLKEMYKREYKFSAIISSLKETVANLQYNSRVPLLGYGSAHSVKNPLFTDGWMAGTCSFTVTPRIPVTGVKFIGWCPDNVSVCVSIKSDDARKEIIAVSGIFDIILNFENPVYVDFELCIDASPVRRASAEDLRDISIIVDSIELLHEFSSQ